MPLGLQLGDSENGHSHDGDDNGSENGKDAFPDILGRVPLVLSISIEDPDESTAEDEADEQAQTNSKPNLSVSAWSVCSLSEVEPSYLSDKFLVSHWVIALTDRLFDESQKNSDNDGSLESLSEGDEEYCRSKVRQIAASLSRLHIPGMAKTLGILAEGE